MAQERESNALFLEVGTVHAIFLIVFAGKVTLCKVAKGLAEMHTKM